MYAGRPVTYTTFLAYDEVAHHSGIERPETLLTLRRVDRELGRIAAAAAEASRPYHLVVLSDHGQSQGATFLDRYGITLEQLVTRRGRGAGGADRARHGRGARLPRRRRSPRRRRGDSARRARRAAGHASAARDGEASLERRRPRGDRTGEASSRSSS